MSGFYQNTSNVAVSLTTNPSGSLGHKISEIANHVHSSGQIYGLTSNTMARKSTSPIVVTGGNGAWGTELELHNGTTIESGSATKYFDLRELYVSAVGTANRITMLEFYYGTKGAGVAATTEFGADTITKNDHGLANGTKIALDTIVGSSGINDYTTYYVVNTAPNTFQISLTSGGGAIDITVADGTCNYSVLSQTLLTEQIISKAAVNSDALVIPLNSPRATCNQRIWCRGWAAGGTNAISFHLGLHTYAA